MNHISWDHVVVEDYDNNRFKIRFDDGLTKYVDRLSLIFESEDPIKFIERVEVARYLKFHTEKAYLTEFFISNEMSKYITINEFSTSDLTRILRTVSREFIKYIPKNRWCRSVKCIGCVKP